MLRALEVVERERVQREVEVLVHVDHVERAEDVAVKPWLPEEGVRPQLGEANGESSP